MAAVYSQNTTQTERDMLLAEYEKPDSVIRILISVEALAKGFDVKDVGCVIDCRPPAKVAFYRDSDVGARSALVSRNGQDGLHPAGPQRQFHPFPERLREHLLQRLDRPGRWREAGQGDPPRDEGKRARRLPLVRPHPVCAPLHGLRLRGAKAGAGRGRGRRNAASHAGQEEACGGPSAPIRTALHFRPGEYGPGKAGEARAGTVPRHHGRLAVMGLEVPRHAARCAESEHVGQDLIAAHRIPEGEGGRECKRLANSRGLVDS
ncbi:helicase-related protein [Achromobacter denitrificans]|uniref:helicase-related protein n=1 Tax=Achromobacter denitrificans TaxID=32002 RepID=UPI003BA98CA8